MGYGVVLQLQLVWLTTFIVIAQCVPLELNSEDFMDELNNSTSNLISTRIYNGKPSIRYNFMVAIIVFLDTGRKLCACGGVLLNPKWVLTAGHCIPELENYIRNKKAQAWVGAQNLIDSEESTIIRQEIIIKGYREYNPKWNSETQTNDIALLQLQTPVDYSNNNFGSICIGTKNYDDIDNIKLIGWGLNNCKSPPTQLNEANGFTLTNEECQTKYNDIIEIQPTMICAFMTGKQDEYAEQAKGDSGGPIFYTNRKGTTVLIGVVSFNKNKQDGTDESNCPDREYPGVYTRTSSYVGWIKSVAGPVKTCI